MCYRTVLFAYSVPSSFPSVCSSICRSDSPFRSFFPFLLSSLSFVSFCFSVFGSMKTRTFQSLSCREISASSDTTNRKQTRRTQWQHANGMDTSYQSVRVRFWMDENGTVWPTPLHHSFVVVVSLFVAEGISWPMIGISRLCTVTAAVCQFLCGACGRAVWMDRWTPVASYRLSVGSFVRRVARLVVSFRFSCGRCFDSCAVRV